MEEVFETFSPSIFQFDDRSIDQKTPGITDSESLFHCNADFKCLNFFVARRLENFFGFRG